MNIIFPFQLEIIFYLQISQSFINLSMCKWKQSSLTKLKICLCYEDLILRRMLIRTPYGLNNANLHMILTATQLK